MWEVAERQLGGAESYQRTGARGDPGQDQAPGAPARAPYAGAAGRELVANQDRPPDRRLPRQGGTLRRAQPPEAPHGLPPEFPHGDGGPEAAYALSSRRTAGSAGWPRSRPTCASCCARVALDDPQRPFEGVGKTTGSSVKIATVEDLPPQAMRREYVDGSPRRSARRPKRSAETGSTRIAGGQPGRSLRVQSSPVESSATGDGWVRTGSLPPRP
jgi:hypothetical protein